MTKLRPHIAKVLTATPTSIMPLRLHPVTTLRGGGDSFAKKCTVRLPLHDYLLLSVYYINAITLAFYRVFMRHPKA